MALFVLDSAGDTNLLKVESHGTAAVDSKPRWRTLEEKVKKLDIDAINKSEVPAEQSENEEDEDFFGLPPLNIDISHIVREELSNLTKPKTKLEEDLERVTEKINNAVQQLQSKRKKFPKNCYKTLDCPDYNPATGKFDVEHEIKADIKTEMSKSKIMADFGRLKEMPFLTKRKKREINRVERSKTKGPQWYGLPATEKTEETTNELKILQMRSVLDPKHFYKKNDLKVLPKYFQIGTVQHSPLDYYSERGIRHKKRSLVDEVLGDETAKDYTKRKFKEVIERREKYAHRKVFTYMK